MPTRDGRVLTKTWREAAKNNPRMAMFVAELRVNGGDTQKAATAAGYKDPEYGAQILRRYPDLARTIPEEQERRTVEVVDEWVAGHRDAIRTIHKLMMDQKGTPPNVRLDAAKFWVERLEGKAPQSIDMQIREMEQDREKSVTFRFAYAIFHSKGWEIERALAYARDNPEQVRAWADRHLSREVNSGG